MNATAASPLPRRSRAWLWFAVLALLQAGAWTAWLIVAAHHRVAEVPVVTAPVRHPQSAIRN